MVDFLKLFKMLMDFFYSFASYERAKACQSDVPCFFWGGMVMITVLSPSITYCALAMTVVCLSITHSALVMTVSAYHSPTVHWQWQPLPFFQSLPLPLCHPLCTGDGCILPYSHPLCTGNGCFFPPLTHCALATAISAFYRPKRIA